MKKYLWFYSIWISATSAIYALLYLYSPLSGYGLMWMTFVSLPIFFTAGAQAKEIPNYFFSMIAGLCWGVLNLWFIGILMANGFPGPISNAIDLLILTIICLGLHMTILQNTFFNKVPMIFGGLAMTFSQGGENILVIAITLTCGILLASVFNLGGTWLEKKILPNQI